MNMGFKMTFTPELFETILNSGERELSSDEWKIVDDTIYYLKNNEECCQEDFTSYSSFTNPFPNKEKIKGIHRHYLYDWAAQHGYLDMIKRFHRLKKEGCTKKTMDIAIKHKRTNVYQWLYEHRNEGLSHRAMRFAVVNNDVEAVKWIHNHYFMSTDSVTIGLSKQFPDMYEFLTGHYKYDSVFFHNTHKERKCNCTVLCQHCNTPIKRVNIVEGTPEGKGYVWESDEKEEEDDKEEKCEEEKGVSVCEEEKEDKKEKEEEKKWNVKVRERSFRKFEQYAIFETDSVFAMDRFNYKTEEHVLKDGGNRVVCENCIKNIKYQKCDIECKYCHNTFVQAYGKNQGLVWKDGEKGDYDYGIATSCTELGFVPGYPSNKDDNEYRWSNHKMPEYFTEGDNICDKCIDVLLEKNIVTFIRSH
jgi:hypothetical protein